MIKLILTDIDGTFIDYELKMPISAQKAVKLAQQKGVYVVTCTGCSTWEVEQRNLGVKFDGFIGGNGCYVEFGGKVVHHKTLTVEQCRHFVEWCAERGLAYRLECNSGMYDSADFELKGKKAMLAYQGIAYEFSEEEKQLVNKKYPVEDRMIRDDVNKTAIVLNSYQDYLDAKEEFADCVVGTWGGVGELALFGDVSPVGVSKGSGIDILLKYLDVKKEEIMGFGDARSDLPMFEKVGIAVAMGNGGKECKEAADYITGDVQSDGFYNALKHFEVI